MQIVKLDTNNFLETISSASKPVIVDFYADWCGPCKMVAPLLEEIAEENKNDVVVYKVNVDESPDIASKYSVASIPTFVAFKNGEQHKTLVGAVPKQSLLSLIQ